MWANGGGRDISADRGECDSERRFYRREFPFSLLYITNTNYDEHLSVWSLATQVMPIPQNYMPVQQSTAQYSCRAAQFLLFLTY